MSDEASKRLTTRVHRSAPPAVDQTLHKRFNSLNELEFTFPYTELIVHLSTAKSIQNQKSVSTNLHRAKEF